METNTQQQQKIGFAYLAVHKMFPLTPKEIHSPKIVRHVSSFHGVPVWITVKPHQLSLSAGQPFRRMGYFLFPVPRPHLIFRHAFQQRHKAKDTAALTAKPAFEHLVFGVKGQIVLSSFSGLAVLIAKRTLAQHFFFVQCTATQGQFVLSGNVQYFRKHPGSPPEALPPGSAGCSLGAIPDGG